MKRMTVKTRKLLVLDVVGDRRCNGEAQQRAEAEQQRDRELLGTAVPRRSRRAARRTRRCRRRSPIRREVAVEVGAQGEDARCERDQAQRLAEKPTCLFAADPCGQACGCRGQRHGFLLSPPSLLRAPSRGRASVASVGDPGRPTGVDHRSVSPGTSDAEACAPRCAVAAQLGGALSGTRASRAVGLCG